MNISIISPTAFEKWYWESPDNPGIGGSETAVVETSRRLAQRGHDVVVYAPVPWEDGASREWKGTVWKSVEQADFSRPGLWILSRCPEKIGRAHV